MASWLTTERGTQRRIHGRPPEEQADGNRLLQHGFNEKRPAEAAQKYGGPHYIQHNPQAADGFEAFVEFVEGFAEQFPQR